MRCLALTLLLLFALSRPAPAAEARELVFIAATNNTLPLARFEGERLVEGILLELGQALARQLGRQPRFVARPSQRVRQALAAGDGDLLCYVLPHWLNQPAQWTLPVLPDAQIVVARSDDADAPPLQRVEQLAGQRVGTVLGYRYEPVERALGGPLLRDDAPTMAANLRKLSLGRLRYALSEQLALDGHRRQHPQPPLSVALVLERFVAPCALSLKSRVPLAEVNAALAELLRQGEVERILQRYR